MLPSNYNKKWIVLLLIVFLNLFPQGWRYLIFSKKNHNDLSENKKKITLTVYYEMSPTLMQVKT